MMIKNNLVRIKERPPYSLDIEDKVLLNSMARATPDPKTGSYTFKPKQTMEVPLDTANVKVADEAIKTLASAGGDFVGVGVDQGMFSFFDLRTTWLKVFTELISSVPSHNPTFVSRNFTDAEIAYCRSQPSPASSFAARWVGKEAVFKSLGVKSKGAAAAMKDIEILNDSESGVPVVQLHGDAQAQASQKGISKVLISLSHSDVSTTFYARKRAEYWLVFIERCYRICSGHQVINCCIRVLVVVFITCIARTRIITH